MKNVSVSLFCFSEEKRACPFEGRLGLIDLSSGEAAKEKQIP